MIVLHIGTDKTGSTAIQKLLYYNKDILNKFNWIYPEIIPMAGYRHWILFNLLQNEKNIKKFEEEIKNINYKNCDNFLFSFEEFYQFTDENIKFFISKLKELDNNIKVLIYLRRQDEKELSDILQGIKTGNIFNYRKYNFEYKPKLDYYKIVKKWEKYVGKENIIIRPYDRKFLPKKDSLIKDFFKYGLNLDYDEIKDKLAIPKSDPNPNLDAVSGMVIDFLADIIKDESKWSLIYQLLGIQENFGKSSKSLFDKKDRLKILDLYKEGNEKLVKEYGVPKELFDLDDKEYEKPDEDDIIEKVKLLYKRKKYLLPLKEWGGEGEFIQNVKDNKILLKKGFYHIEKWGVWTKGNEKSVLAFLVFRDFMNGNEKIKLKLKVRYSNSITRSALKIYNINCGEIMAGENMYEIDTKLIRENGGIVFLEFEHKNSKSPRELGINNDERIIGVGIEKINFEEIL